MSNLITHAERELKLAGYFDGDPINQLMAQGVLQLIDQFASAGHSGFSAMAALQLFEKLAKFEPLIPLTGTDEEWVEVSPNLFQNKRCSHVFKDDIHAWDMNGKIFEDQDGGWFTSSDSNIDITFPYTPVCEYVKYCEV